MSSSKGDLHASLTQMEANLFRAEYLGEINPADPDARAIPDFHIGTSADEVRVWVEQMARAMGYNRVIWDSK